MKTYVKVALFFVLFIAVSAILAALYFYNLKHTDMSQAKPDYVLTSTELREAFEQNETAASAKYINKIIEVSGTIAAVNPGKDKIVTITLQTGSDLSSIICTFPAVGESLPFTAGDNINLRGECSGFLMDVLLNNCALIKSKTN